MVDLQAKYMQITRKKHASKTLHQLLHAPQFHMNCMYMYFGKVSSFIRATLVCSSGLNIENDAAERH